MAESAGRIPSRDMRSRDEIAPRRSPALRWRRIKRSATLIRFGTDGGDLIGSLAGDGSEKLIFDISFLYLKPFRYRI